MTFSNVTLLNKLSTAWTPTDQRKFMHLWIKIFESITYLGGRIIRKILLYFHDHISISRKRVTVIHLLNPWFGINDKNPLQTDASMVVRNCVPLSISKSPHKRIDIKQFTNGFNHICFDVARIFGYLVKEGVCELLRLHHYGSIDSTCRLQIAFRVLVERQSSHC